MPRKSLQPSIAENDAAPGGTASVDRALSVLNVFSPEKPIWTLAEIAAQTLLYKSGVLRFLASLEHAGLVQRTADGKYCLGPKIARLNAAYTASFSLADVVVPVMHRLVAATRESASFHVRQGEQRLCLYRVDSPQPIRDHIRAGDLLPLDRGAGGRVLMAFDGAQGAIYDEIREKKLISKVGDRSEEVAGISSPVFDAAGRVVGALTLTMPATRFKHDHEPHVRAAAIEITEALGGAASLFG